MTTCACILALLCAAPAGVDDGAPGAPRLQEDPGDDVKAWLRYLDTRIYAQPSLEAVSFRFRPRYPGLDGAPPRPAPYVVSYHWRQGFGDRVDLLGIDPESKSLRPLSSLPGHSRQQYDRAVSDFRKVGASFGQIIRGMSLSEQYKDFRGRVRRVEFNVAEEITLILEPQKAHRLSRVVIHLNRLRIPWKLDKLFKSGDRVAQHHTYEKRPEGHVITKVSRDHTPAHPAQPSFDTAYVLAWQRVNAVLLPASIERMGRNIPDIAKGKTSFTALRINGDVTKFEAMPAPSSKPPAPNR